MDEYGLNVWMNRKEKKENGNEKREKEKISNFSMALRIYCPCQRLLLLLRFSLT